MGYLPLRISTVRPNEKLTFDLFIFFKETYLCYTKKGIGIEPSKLEQLKSQDIAKFYITEADADNYQIFIDQTLLAAMNDPALPMEDKMDISQGVAETALDNYQDADTEKNFSMTTKAANGLRQVISSNPAALKRLFGKKSKDSDRIIKHSLNVCGLSIKLAEKMKCKEDELEDLATACLIHDIGITKLSKDEKLLFMKQKSNFSPTDKRLYGFHVKDSAVMLQSKSYVNKRVQDLVMNHEENKQGTGPNKKRDLTLLEEILSLVNNFDKRLIITEALPGDVLKAMTIEDMGFYDLKLMEKFKKVLDEEGLLD